MQLGKILTVIIIAVSFGLGYLSHGMVNDFDTDQELKKVRMQHTATLVTRLVGELADYVYWKSGALSYLDNQEEVKKKLIESHIKSHIQIVESLSEELESALVIYGDDISPLKGSVEKTLNTAAMLINQ